MNTRWLWLAAAALLGAWPARALSPVSAAGWQIGPFVRPEGVNPVVSPDAKAEFVCPVRKEPVRWEASHAFNPGAVVKDGKVFLLFRAEDESGAGIGSYTSRLGLASSEDGLKFKVEPGPVFYPDNDAQKDYEWPGGCEDPRLVEGPDGIYVLLYTQWNRKSTHLAAATSRDLTRWNKHGPVFAKALEGRYKDLGCKSGAIVCRLEEGRLRAARVAGKYWMYWGEGNVALASSDNLLDWTVVETEPGRPRALLAPREGHFESGLAEAGPNAVWTEKGIVVLYNGKNDTGEKRDHTLGAGVYSGGQATFDANDPAKLLWRAEEPFFKPERSYEMTGQYRQGTTFLEGLVYFRDRWFLYYGCADSDVAVAVCDPAAAKPK